MSLRRSPERNKNDRHHHRQRSRSPFRHHREEDPHNKRKNRRQDSTSEVDLRRVKREPDESDGAREVNKVSSRSMPVRNSEVDHSPQGHQDNLRQQREERRKNDKQRLKHRSEQGLGKEQWGRQHHSDSTTADKKADKVKDKEKPSLALSGHLTEDTNTFRGVVIKYNEPPEARRPKKHWRFYPFKGEEQLPVLHLHRQSAFLLGRDRRVADIPVDHPSCSKQHAALQFRLVEYTRPDGRTGRRVRPYVIDLGSANGTYVNNQRIEAQRYVELIEKDVVKFGFSSREYVLLHDSSDTTELDDDEGTV